MGGGGAPGGGGQGAAATPILSSLHVRAPVPARSFTETFGGGVRKMGADSEGGGL